MEDEIIKIHDKLLKLLKNKDSKEIKELYEVTPPIDIAEALEDINDITILLYALRVAGTDYAADLFTELDSDKQELIINAFTDKELITILENSFADDIVDSIEDFPANMVNRILKVAPAELRKDINTLLRYEDNTAGSVMTTEYIEMKDNTLVKDAIASIRANGREAETVFTIFVKDDKRNMVGTVDLDDLIFANEDEKLKDIMNVDFKTCFVTDDQEEVANDFKRYDLNAMAVVNKQNKILGIITIDDVVDIIVEEANEDIAHLSQVSSIEDEYLKTPIWKLVIKCAPWILALMVLQVFSTLILSRFESAIASLALLSFFTPLIMDAGGNSGNQTTTLMVRSIALEEFQKGDFKKVVWKEFRVSLIIAGIIAIFSFGWLMFEMSVGIVSLQETMEKFPDMSKVQIMLSIAGLVAVTLFATMIISRLVGCILPFVAKAFKRDPAVMCGPLTTTIVDITSLLTYFLLWTYVFSPIFGL